MFVISELKVLIFLSTQVKNVSVVYRSWYHKKEKKLQWKDDILDNLK